MHPKKILSAHLHKKPTPPPQLKTPKNRNIKLVPKSSHRNEDSVQSKRDREKSREHEHVLIGLQERCLKLERQNSNLRGKLQKQRKGHQNQSRQLKRQLQQLSQNFKKERLKRRRLREIIEEKDLMIAFLRQKLDLSKEKQNLAPNFQKNKYAVKEDRSVSFCLKQKPDLVSESYRKIKAQFLESVGKFSDEEDQVGQLTKTRSEQIAGLVHRCRK